MRRCECGCEYEKRREEINKRQGVGAVVEETDAVVMCGNSGLVTAERREKRAKKKE